MKSKKRSFKQLFYDYYLFIKGFLKDLFDDKLGHYASSLSWSTLFSMIPLLVIMLAIFTSMPIFNQVYDKVEKMIFANLMPTESKVVISYINQFIESTDKLGILGAVYVLFAVIMFFKNYDYIVNDIFGVPTRNWWQAVKTYTKLLLIIPVMIGLSFYISMFIQQHLNEYSYTRFIHLTAIIPYLIVWMMFYLAYQISPNTDIDTSTAMISSFIASLIWYLGKSAFVFYVVHNKTYTSIYGTVSTLLFFFLWIYISWAIFIYGLKFCAILEREEDINPSK